MCASVCVCVCVRQYVCVCVSWGGRGVRAASCLSILDLHSQPPPPLPLPLTPCQVLWSLVRTGLLLVALSFAWLVGSQAVRRSQAMSTAAGSGAVASASSAAPSSSGSVAQGFGGLANNGGSGATPSTEPREYRKEELPEKSVKNFGDVRGCDEAKEELLEVGGFRRRVQAHTSPHTHVHTHTHTRPHTHTCPHNRSLSS